jgi:hypothetical protein
VVADALGDWNGLISDAIEVAHNDVNYDNYRGVAVVIFSPFLRGQAAFGTNTFNFTGGSINNPGDIHVLIHRLRSLYP